MIPPVLERELRASATRSRTFWLRTLIAGATLGLWLSTVLLNGIPITDGRAALALLGAVPWLLAMAAGLITTADCLSREKREATLPLLLLTELRPWEIVAQKFLAGSANLFFILLALSPVFGLSVLLGGVTIWQVLGFILLLLPVAYASASLGCFVSSLVRRPLDTTLGTFALLATSCGLSFLVKQVLPGSLLTSWLEGANPAVLYWKLIHGTITPGEIASSLLLLIGIGTVLLAGSSLALKAFLFPQTKLQNRRFNPTTCGGGAGTLILGVLVISFLPATGFWFPVSMVLLNTGLKLMVAVEAARVFNQKQWLEVVLTTPMELRGYVVEQFRWVARRTAPAFALTLCGNILLASKSWGNHFDFAVLAIILLLSDCLALVWAGFASGLQFSRLNEALVWSVGKVLVLPASIYLLGILLGVRTVTFASALLLYGMLAVGLGALNATAAVWLLHHRLRMLAAPA